MSNKYQESLDRLNTINMVNFIGDKELIKHKDNDIKTLQELVDKETPKKYKSKTDKDGRMIWVCPKCNEILVKFWSEVETVSHLPYCYMCGQKLDWSDE